MTNSDNLLTTFFELLNASFLPLFNKLMAKLMMSIDNNPENKRVNVYETEQRKVATSSLRIKPIT